VGDDVDAVQTFERRSGQGFPALDGRQVRLHELDAVDGLGGSAGDGDHSDAAGQEAVDGSAAGTLGAAADNDPLSGELRRINLHVMP
jgi:hypothetical protein